MFCFNAYGAKIESEWVWAAIWRFFGKNPGQWKGTSDAWASEDLKIY